MPTFLLANGNPGVTLVAGALTRYCACAGANDSFINSTDAFAQARARGSYTLAGLWCRVTGNTISGASTIKSRKNTADGNQLLTIPALTTGAFSDDVNSDALVDGDLFNYQVITGGPGPESLIFTALAGTLAAATDINITLKSGKTSTTTGTQYTPLHGACYHRATESRSQYVIRTAATFTNLRIHVPLNTRDGASTVVFRINALVGNLTVAIPASTTGAFEDNVNSDAPVAGNSINFRLVVDGAAGAIDVALYNTKVSATIRWISASKNWTDTIGFGVTTFTTIEGDSQAYAAEANVQIAARAAFTGRNMFVRVITNSLTGNLVIRTRKNGGPGNLSVTFAATVTGVQEDLVNTDTFVAADSLDWTLDTSAAGAGSAIVTIIGLEDLPTAPPPGMKGSVVPLLRAVGVM